MSPDDDLDEDPIDDDNDDDDAAALARFRQAEAHLRNTPPRCLAGFTVTPTTLPGVPFDGHGSALNKIYQLACPCGHDRFRALGHPVHNQGIDIFVSPLALECAACGKVTELIDTDQHGYDAELGHGAATIRGDDGPRTPYACDQCGVRPMTAHARFEHSGEELADSFLEDFPNSQDYFSWFTLIGTCDTCHHPLTVADFECA